MAYRKEHTLVSCATGIRIRVRGEVQFTIDERDDRLGRFDGLDEVALRVEQIDIRSVLVACPEAVRKSFSRPHLTSDSLHVRSVGVDNKPFGIQRHMVIRGGFRQRRVHGGRRADSKRIQTRRLRAVPLSVEKGVSVVELQGLQTIAEVEIVCAVVRRQDEVNDLLAALPVDGSIAVRSHTSECPHTSREPRQRGAHVEPSVWLSDDRPGESAVRSLLEASWLDGNRAPNASQRIAYF